MRKKKILENMVKVFARKKRVQELKLKVTILQNK